MTHFEEDITLAAGATYTTGGSSLTVKKAQLVESLNSISLTSDSGTGTTTYPYICAVKGSQSGQTVKYRAFQVPASSAGAQNLTELANASSAVASLTLHVSYEGT